MGHNGRGSESSANRYGKRAYSDNFHGKVYKLNDIVTDTEHRYDTGLHELNRVLGGGLVKGSLVL